MSLLVLFKDRHGLGVGPDTHDGAITTTYAIPDKKLKEAKHIGEELKKKKEGEKGLRKEQKEEKKIIELLTELELFLASLSLGIKLPDDIYEKLALMDQYFYLLQLTLLQRQAYLMKRNEDEMLLLLIL